MPVERILSAMSSKLKKMAVLVTGAIMFTGALPQCDLTVKVENLRSTDGKIQLCITRHKEYFPDCEKDSNARFVTVSASAKVATFSGLGNGDYALAVFHDENGNANLDTFAGIPKEGIGFSRNPNFTFGPPKFSKATFTTQSGRNVQNVKMKYFL